MSNESGSNRNGSSKSGAYRNAIIRGTVMAITSAALAPILGPVAPIVGAAVCAVVANCEDPGTGEVVA